jgi:hypothetical protein
MRMAKGTILTMRLPSRRTFWLSAATLLVAIVACGWFFVPRSRVNWENYERIQNGMTFNEVLKILGNDCLLSGQGARDGVASMYWTWKNDPSHIEIWLVNGKVREKGSYIATPWQTVQWYAKKGADKIGIK